MTIGTRFRDTNVKNVDGTDQPVGIFHPRSSNFFIYEIEFHLPSEMPLFCINFSPAQF